MFTTDRDLLVLEPTLFRDLGWLGQRLVSAPGTIAGSTLTVTGVDFAALNVTTGSVVLADGVGLEVTARLSATTLTVSRPRALLGDAVIPPSPGSIQRVLIQTFRPQIAVVHEQLLRTLGIEPAGSTLQGAVTEMQITNPRALALAESLASLHFIYAAAAAPGPADGPLAARAESYRLRASMERSRIQARIDLNGDGQPEATRYANLSQFTRA